MDLAKSQFGPSVLVPILLQGPADQLDRQGPIVVRRLDVRQDTKVISAWSGGDTGKQLRPSKTSAMIVASVARTEEEMVNTVQPQLDRTVQQAVSGPVKAHITGQPTIDRALKQETVDRTRTAELIAIPILFFVLLALLGAPVAALVIAAFGAVTTLAGFGAMTLLGEAIDVDATAIALGSVTGLALGVGYTLMIYRRWQEDGVATAVETSGRAVLIGGTSLIIALILATMIAPTTILTSLGIGVLLCAALAVVAAVVVMPAVISLAGQRLQWLSFGLPGPVQRTWDRLASGHAVIRNAALAAPVAIAVLLLLAVPAVSLKTGPPSPSLLPKDSVARQDFEAVGRAMGPGWASPFNVVVASQRAPVTDKATLASLGRFQASWAKDVRVASVVGPGPIKAKADELNVLPKKLAESNKLLKGGKKELGKLQAGLGQAGAGVVTLREGLQAAAAGAGQAGGGAGQLHAGLQQAHAGAAQISGGLHQALAGATRLRNGSAELLAGAKEINAGLGAAAGPVKAGLPAVGQMVGDVGAGYSAVQGASQSSKALTGQLATALGELQKMQAGKSDPAYQSALGALSSASTTADGVSGTLAGAQSKLAFGAVIAGGLQKKITELSGGLSRLYAGSGRLQAGIGRLQSGNAELTTGIAALAAGGGDLTSGLSQLSAGAATLQAGLGTLSGKLSGGTGPAGQLAAGLGTAKSKVAKFRSDLPSPKDLEQLQKESPGLFASGYFVLAAIDGASAAAQTQPSFVVNIDQGGSAAQIAVVSRYPAGDPRTQALGDDLRSSAQRFAATTATEAAVGGPAGELTDFASVTQSRIALVIIVLSAAIAVQLMLALRTIVLPLIAVAFDLLTAAAAFGVLALLFSGDNPPLGGPGFIDPMSIIGIFAAIFGLTIVYEVMLLHRTREEFLECGDAHQALRNALRPTAYAATGAALVALAAVGPFLATDLLAVRQFGVGLAVAVVLDAFIVRPVLLPATVELLGRWGWWPMTRSAPVTPTLPSSPTPAV